MERYHCRQTSTYTTREWGDGNWKLTCEAHGTTISVSGNVYADSVARFPARWCASCRELLVVVRCDCGKSYTAEEWCKLKLMGLLTDIEMRRCTCNETLYLDSKRGHLKTKPGFYRNRAKRRPRAGRGVRQG